MAHSASGPHNRLTTGLKLASFTSKVHPTFQHLVTDVSGPLHSIHKYESLSQHARN